MRHARGKGVRLYHGQLVMSAYGVKRGHFLLAAAYLDAASETHLSGGERFFIV